MTHVVIWSRRALDQLTTFWMKADAELRAAITAAAFHVEQQLKNNPHAQGESRPDQRRIHFVPPLAILFEVREGIARILYAWDSRRK